MIPVNLKSLKVTMPTTTLTILDQIATEKTKLSERLARLDTERATVATRLTDLETAERVLTRVSKTPPLEEAHFGCRRRSKHTRSQPRPRAAAKGSHEQVSRTQTQRTEPRRARPGPGYRQDPTGALHGVPQRSPEPCRYPSAAPSPCRTDPGA